MINNIGLAGSGAIMAGMILGGSVFPLMLLHWRRSKGRKFIMNSDNGARPGA
jgi:hypothetical protein